MLRNTLILLVWHGTISGEEVAGSAAVDVGEASWCGLVAVEVARADSIEVAWVDSIQVALADSIQVARADSARSATSAADRIDW